MTTRPPRLATATFSLAMLLASTPVGTADAATLEDIFSKRCASCHGMDGSSDTPSGRALKVRPLLDDARIAAMSPAEIVEDIRTHPKHRAVIDFGSISRSELLAAAEYVRRLCAGR